MVPAPAQRARSTAASKIHNPQSALGSDGNVREVFQSIYLNNNWDSLESASGPGSEVRRTGLVRSALPDLLQRFGIRSILDAPCGDFNWLQRVNIGDCRYIGIDIVADLIERNVRRYSSLQHSFLSGDITTLALPQVDLILCRDCWVHLPNSMIQDCLRNFQRSGSRLLLTTSYSEQIQNVDVILGGFRPINLERSPFLFPPPIFEVRDDPDPGQAIGRCLALWPLDALPAQFDLKPPPFLS